MTGGQARPRTALPVLLAVLAACLTATAAAAQEVGVYRTGASSELRDLSDASGIGAHLLLFWPGLNVRGSIYSQQSVQTRAGRSCVRVNPPVNCGEEDITRDTRLRGVSVAAALPVLTAGMLQLEVGGGVSFNLLESEDRVPSGRLTTLLTEKGGQLGLLASAAARIQPIPAVPVVLYALAARHQVRFTACGEYEWMDDPFCGAAALNELRAGVGYVIRR